MPVGNRSRAGTRRRAGGLSIDETGWREGRRLRKALAFPGARRVVAATSPPAAAYPLRCIHIAGLMRRGRRNPRSDFARVPRDAAIRPRSALHRVRRAFNQVQRRGGGGYPVAWIAPIVRTGRWNAPGPPSSLVPAS